MKDTDFKKIFAAYRVDVPDEGFSERVNAQLPERKSMLPQMVMITFIVIGAAIMFAIHGVAPFLEQIDSLVTSISRLQIPSPSSITVYICSIALTGMIGFSVAQADA